MNGVVHSSIEIVLLCVRVVLHLSPQNTYTQINTYIESDACDRSKVRDWVKAKDATPLSTQWCRYGIRVMNSPPRLLMKST